MKIYTFVVETVITMHTEVEADSLGEAIKEAQSRGPMSLCHQCAAGESDAWNTSGELDGEPAAGTLVDVYCDGTEVSLGEVKEDIPRGWDDSGFIAAAREDIPWLVAEVERLTDLVADYRRDAEAAMRESCDAGAWHCTCVPSLRAEVERLREALSLAARRDCLGFRPHNGEHYTCTEARAVRAWWSDEDDCPSCIARAALDETEENDG